MNESNIDDEKDRSNASLIKGILIIAAMIIILVLALYIFNFDTNKLADSNEIWGQFGDYVGGTLNPALSFLALIALLYTIKLQSRGLRLSTLELEATRKELSETKDIHRKQSLIMDEQSKQIIVDNFESTYFKLIDSIRLTINDLRKPAGQRRIDCVPSCVSYFEASIKNIENLNSFKVNRNNLLPSLEAYIEKIEIASDFLMASVVEDKVFYARILGANLNVEEKIIAYISSLEYLQKSFVVRSSYIGKYIFDGVPPVADPMAKELGWELHWEAFNFG